MSYNQAFWSPGYNRFETTITNTPQVIGEGDVITNVSPDGIIQYFFIPISQWLPYVANPTVKSNYNNLNPNLSSWFVRSISYPLPPELFNCPYQRSSVVPIPPVAACYNSDSNLNRVNPGFQLKFHNDIWTSTTDLYYFCPGTRQCNWIPRTHIGSAAVQVELPVLSKTICHCETICNKRCHCPKKTLQNRSKNDIINFTQEESRMSVEDTGSKEDVKHKKSNKHCTKKCNVERKSNKTQIFCKCERVQESAGTSDKLITTFADQKTGCTPEVGRETQTIFKNNSFTNTTTSTKDTSKRKGIKPEVWHPKTSYAKKAIKPESSKTKACKSDRWSGTTSESCDCNSETE